MGEFFGRDSENQSYHNAIKKGNMPKPKKHFPLNNACGFSNCCGLAATGDEALPPVESPSPAPVDSKVKNLQRWGYVKTGLALVGAYVVIKFLYGKFVK
jgi:hypothetical protein